MHPAKDSGDGHDALRPHWTYKSFYDFVGAAPMMRTATPDADRTAT